MDNDINREINIEQVEFGIDIDNIEYSIEINPRDTFAIELNEQGPQGARGYTGNGISSYELTSTAGLIDTYTITFTDGNTTTVDVTNGRGIASITGPVSVDNVDTYTINYNDNTISTFTVTNGIDGVNPTVTVGSTTTGNPGTNASVVNSGTTQDVILDFTIPRGEKGEPGEDGTDGADGFSPIATVTTTPTGATISITDANGTTTTNITNGTDGSAATIAVGTVTTGLPTDPASVTNVGTSSAAVFDFTIPKGDKGDTGSTGATGNGVVNTEYISSSGLVDTYHINYTNGNYDSFTVTNGQNGTGSVADVWVNGTSVLDGDIAKVIVPTNNNQLTNGAGYITGITSSDVTTALGYTPYDSSNPSGYTSNVGTVISVNNVSPISGDVTLTASDIGAEPVIGYTPVNKDGDTMTGGLGFSMADTDRNCYLQNTGITKGTAPSSNTWYSLGFYDKDGVNASNLMGFIGTIYYNTGAVATTLRAYKPVSGSTDNARINVGYDVNGNEYCSFPNTTCVDSQWVISEATIIEGASAPTSTSLSYSLAQYLPNDNYDYEVIITGYGVTGNSSGNQQRIQIQTDLMTNHNSYLWYTLTRTSSTAAGGGTMNAIVGNDRKIYVTYYSVNTGTFNLYARAYRRIGTNS